MHEIPSLKPNDYIRSETIVHKKLGEGFIFWVLEDHLEEEIPTIQHEWPSGYKLVAEPTDRQTQLLFQGELHSIVEYVLVGEYPET